MLDKLASDARRSRSNQVEVIVRESYFSHVGEEAGPVLVELKAGGVMHTIQCEYCGQQINIALLEREAITLLECPACGAPIPDVLFTQNRPSDEGYDALLYAMCEPLGVCTTALYPVGTPARQPDSTVWMDGLRLSDRRM